MARTEWLDPVEVEYPRVERLITKAVKAFHAVHGGHWDTLVADGNYHFMRCYHAYEDKCQNGAKFSTWVYWYVYNGLFDDMRRNMARSRNTYTNVEAEMGELRVADPIPELIEQLTDDGALVCELTLHTPKELDQEVERKGGAARNYRSSIRQYLTNQGWSRDRINHAYKEIREVICP